MRNIRRSIAAGACATLALISAVELERTDSQAVEARPPERPAAVDPAAAASGALSVRGIALPLHSPADDHGPALRELPGLGASHVALFVHLYQRDGTSAAPAAHPTRTPTEAALRAAIQAARSAGLQVALIPSVLLETPRDDEWRGNIRPPSWATWFAAYRAEVARLARLAERESVSIVSIGSELTSAEGQVTEWATLVRAVRAEFHGRVTYSANWDHYREVPFWDQLDAIGLSAYYELSTSTTPTPAELLAAWRATRDRLLDWRRERRLNAPLLFLELGYPSVDGCASRPWDYTQAGAVDLEEQRLCYAAFAEAWRDVPELDGVFFYEWTGEGGPHDRRYTPRGKPALEVVRALFAAGR